MFALILYIKFCVCKLNLYKKMVKSSKMQHIVMNYVPCVFSGVVLKKKAVKFARALHTYYID